MGYEWFGEVIGKVFVGRDMLDVDGSSLDEIVDEVVFDVNEFSAFGGRRVLGDKDGSLAIYEERFRLGFRHAGFAEEPSEPVDLLCGGGGS